MMPSPFDYTLNVQDPVLAMQSGMAFGQNQRANEQAMVMNDQSMVMNDQAMGLKDSAEARAQTQFGQNNTLFDQQQQDRAAAQENAAAMNADFSALAELVTEGKAGSADFAAMALKYPDTAAEITKMWDGMSKERKDADVAELYKGVAAIKAGRPDIAVKMLEDRAVAAENAGDQMEADTARAMAAAITADPNAGLTSLGFMLQVADPGATDKLFGQGRRVQSTNAYANGTTVTVFTDGTKEVTDASGTVISGPDAQAAVDAAMQSEGTQRGINSGAGEQAKADVKIGTSGEIKAEEKAAENNQAIVASAQSALTAISSTIRNYDSALEALDAGANTGVIAGKIPTLTVAGALLENAKMRLGLDVIASVTFGALSEGERAAAMAIAMPTNLPPEDLRKWINDRKTAETKIAAVQRAAVEHFSQSGKSQRDLAQQWVNKYSDTIPGVQEAFDAQFGGATSTAPDAVSGGGQGSPVSTGDPALDALLNEVGGL